MHFAVEGGCYIKNLWMTYQGGALLTIESVDKIVKTCVVSGLSLAVLPRTVPARKS